MTVQARRSCEHPHSNESSRLGRRDVSGGTDVEGSVAAFIQRRRGATVTHAVLPSRLTVELLGPVVARKDGAEVSIGGPVDRAVLGLLALRAGERVPVGDLLAGAYGGVPRDSARRALQTAVWRLRRALGDGLIVSDHGGYRLDIEPVDCDACGLRQATVAARVAKQSGDITGAIAHLSSALRLWRGHNPDLPARAADAIDDVVAHAVEEWAGLLLATGRPAEALDHLDRIGARDRHPRLSELRAEAKRRCGSLAAVAVRDPLPAHLGRLLASGPLIGRDAHIDALDGHRRVAADGQARLVIISGSRGAGTSRLAAEVAAATIDSGGSVWHGRGGVDWAPLRAVADVVRAALADADDETRSRALGGELGRLVPDLADSAWPVAGALDFNALTAALVELTRAASQRALLTIVLDDLREEDAGLLLLAHGLVDAIRQGRLLVIAACGDHGGSAQPPAAPIRPSDLLVMPEVYALPVGPLNLSETRALLEQLAPAPDGTAFAAAAFELTGGLPRLLLAMHRNPALLPDRPGWAPDGNSPTAALTSARLATLAPSSRTLVELAAVIAPASLAELDAVAEAAGSSVAGAVLDSLALACDAGVLAVSDAGAGVTFRSLSVQRGVLDGLGPSRRATLHAAAAEGLLAVHGPGAGGHVVSISDHLAAAVPVVDPAKAVDAVLRSGDDLLLRGDAPAAAARFERALALLAGWRPGDVDRTITALLALGRALETSGFEDDASAAWDRACGLASDHDRPDGVALAALELAGTQNRPRIYIGAADVLDRAIRVLPPDAELRSLVIQRRVQLDRFAPAPGPQRVLASLPAVTDRLLIDGLRPTDAAAQATVALFQWVAGVEDGTRTMDDDERLAALFAQAPDAHSLQLLWHRWTVARATASGRLVDGEKALATIADRIDKAAAVARTTLQRDDVLHTRRTSAFQLANLRSLSGRFAEARAAADLIAFEADNGRFGPHVDGRSLAALYVARSGDRPTAQRMVDTVIGDLQSRPHDRYRFATAVQIAWVAADLADSSAATWLRAELEPHRGRHCLIGYAGYGGVTEHALGRLAAAMGDLDEADDLLATGLIAYSSVGAHVFAALSRMWRADALRRMGGAARQALAAELAAEAEASFMSFKAEADALLALGRGVTVGA